MTINREDLLAVFPHLDWVISERQPYRDEYYDSAHAAVLPGEEDERGSISLIRLVGK